MSLKMHFLHSHLNFFFPNLGEVSDEQGEIFCHDMSVIERRYRGRFNAYIMGDFFWYLQRESKGSSYKKKPNALNISKVVSHGILRNKIHLFSVAVVCLVRNGIS